MSSKTGQSPEAEKKCIDSIADAIPEMGVTYQGKALFIPSIARIVEATGMNRIEMYRGKGFEDKIQAATGLEVIYRTGFVLGDPACADSVFDREFLDQSRAILEVERLASKARQLNPAARDALIARLAISES